MAVRRVNWRGCGVPAGLRRRTVAPVDVENLLSRDPASADEADFEWAIYRFAAAADLQVSDLVVVAMGTGGSGAFGVRQAWPTALVRVRRGVDGADQALTDELWDLD